MLVWGEGVTLKNQVEFTVNKLFITQFCDSWNEHINKISHNPKNTKHNLLVPANKHSGFCHGPGLYCTS